MQFQSIVGQELVKKHLILSAQKGIIPHAQLFSGREGVGKLAIALAYIQYLNCSHPKDNDSCGQCPSCQKNNLLIHPDVHFIYPIVKKDKKSECDDYLPLWREQIVQSSYITYQQWLDAMQVGNMQALIYEKESEQILRKLSLKQYESPWKAVIVWHPEKMHPVAANALLKIIEEPPKQTLFILLSDNPEQVLPTILSRCQEIHVPPITQEDLEQGLRQRFSLSSSEAQRIAHIAQGSFSHALELMEANGEHGILHDFFVEMMRASYLRNIKRIKKIADDLSKQGREKQKNFFDYAQRMIREYFVQNANIPQIVYLNQNEADFGVKFAPFVNERNIEELSEEFTLAALHIEQNVNPKMVFFDLCLKVTLLLKR